MSSSIWTPAALSSEALPLEGRCWRLVEAQHRVSTLKLVDTLEEQDLLEGLLEAAKPPVPPECRHLDYLLATPFRYSPYPRGSRFRRPGHSEGVFYGAERPETAVAEMAFYRLLFFAESPGTPWPRNPAEYTAFAAACRSERMLDLTRPPLDRDSPVWSDPVDYAACQVLADGARAARIEIIRYRSVRDPEGRANLALLTCRVFIRPKPTALQTWRLHLQASGVQAICESPRLRLAFDAASFANDPRIAALEWKRNPWPHGRG
ncbi:RES family NAD+ phosphorylase [Geminicoccaceae bacterium 1502E]|nr:RES family NAD+ phosphorylase [Geminicoccaceae bacterium 1502E]